MPITLICMTQMARKIYSVKTTLSGDGYPLDISISSDAKKLIASIIKVSGDEIKTSSVLQFFRCWKKTKQRVVGVAL